jgi:hypothetical protein
VRTGEAIGTRFAALLTLLHLHLHPQLHHHQLLPSQHNLHKYLVPTQEIFYNLILIPSPDGIEINKLSIKFKMA